MGYPRSHFTSDEEYKKYRKIQNEKERKRRSPIKEKINKKEVERRSTIREKINKKEVLTFNKQLASNNCLPLI